MINTEKFNQIVSEAKAKTNDPKWLRAIEKAAAAILSGEMIVTTLANGALVTTANGTYACNGTCCCRAAQNGHTQCRHRDAARLMDIYETDALSVSFADDVATSSRENLIAEIKNIWPRFAPGLPLAVELMARFRVNRLEMLDDGSLRDIRLAVAI